jgi:hypothetical protein
MEKPEREPFKLSIQTNRRQIFVIVIILLFIVLIPLTIDYIQNPDKVNIKESITSTFQKLKPVQQQSDKTQYFITLPIVQKEVDVSVLKNNPQILIYAGIGFFIIAMIIGITLLRNISRH